MKLVKYEFVWSTLVDSANKIRLHSAELQIYAGRSAECEGRGENKDIKRLQKKIQYLKIE